MIDKTIQSKINYILSQSLYFSQINGAKTVGLKLKEELNELLLELQHDSSKDNAHEKNEHIKRLIDEVSDCILMLLQACYILGQDEVIERIYFKIRRQNNRFNRNLNVILSEFGR